MKIKTLFFSLLLVIFTTLSITVFAAEKQERNVSSFTKIDVGVAFKVYLKQGSNQSVVVEIDDEYIDNVKTNVSNSTLYIMLDTKPNKSKNRNIDVMNVYITIPEIDGITATAAAKIRAETPITIDGNLSLDFSAAAKMEDATITCKDLNLDLSGAAECTLNVNAENIDVTVNGASKIELAGNAKQLNVDASGASKVDVLDLKVEKTDINKSGVASIVGYQ